MSPFSFLGALMRRPTLRLIEPATLRFRVRLTDLDINVHMTNSRYLRYMDLGRVDLVARTGLVRASIRHRWRFIAASLTIRYRQSLGPLEAFELKSRIVCWDTKWMFIEQRFEREGKAVAIALVKALFRAPAGNVPTAEVLKALGVELESPEMPPFLQHWRQAEGLMV